MELPSTETRETLRAFWQARFHHFSEGKRSENLTCMHKNPMNRGLVSHPASFGVCTLQTLTVICGIDRADRGLSLPGQAQKGLRPLRSFEREWIRYCFKP
jgi:hypothetical protein